MKKLEIGMKIYDLDWFFKYNFSYQEAAKLLNEWGVTSVLVRTRLQKKLENAVPSNISSDEVPSIKTYDDRKFRDALAKEGIEYWLTVRTFYEPKAIEDDPSLLPTGSDGNPMEKIDWYVGIAPSMEKFVNQQTSTIEQETRELEPDGIFLSFTRWPGFWELWMLDVTRQDFPEYSYDRHTLDRFVNETGLKLPTRDPAAAAAWIEENARDTWTEWKCHLVVEAIGKVKESCRNIHPSTQIMLNTLPFSAGDFDGAREKVFGQHIETLADVVDVFEVMTYHQILRRPVSWIPQAGEEVKRRSGRKTLCTIQSSPIYLDGIYAKDKRSPSLDHDEFAEAVSAVSSSNVDGIVVFVWSDLLKEVILDRDYRRVDALRAVV